MTPTPKPVMLCILDGWGLSQNPVANAVALGNTPNFDRLWQQFPHTTLSAHGNDVGLQPGVFGNSEVGHLNIGAGRVVWQDSLLIDREIDSGEFFKNEAIRASMNHAKSNDTNFHLIGLVSDGSVHSSETHILALIDMAEREGLRADQVLLHAFTDGRDTPPQSAEKYLHRVLEQMKSVGMGRVASVIGRYYAMDRDNRWERVQSAYDCLTSGKGHTSNDAISAIKEAYARGENDEFIHATAIEENGQILPRICDNDAVLFFNYRSDRGRQLTHAFIDEHFDAQPETSTEPGAKTSDHPPTIAKFQRTVWPRVHFTTMTRYSSELNCPIAFEPRPQRDGLGETVSKAGKTQLRIAETEKYPHVTYFFSGGIETPWSGEERVLVSSPKVATYDLQPAMSSWEVTQKVVDKIENGGFDLIVLNYANPDMVGHTGVLAAAIESVEATDKGLGEILKSIEKVGGVLLVIADHGNCEQMLDYETGEPHTAHTTNPVPCILFGADTSSTRLRNGGRLADVSPTLLELLNVPQPNAMTGQSLLEN